jgi:hypothetical protein
MPNKTLGTILNAGLREIGEPPITALTSTSILELSLIESVNNTITEINDAEEYSWTYGRTTISTVADVATGKCAVTKGATTVSSVNDSGVNATNWTSGVSAGMWIRIANDKTSYKITAVDSSSTPNTVTIDTAYAGATATAAEYTIFQDTFAISASDFDEVKTLSYGDSRSWVHAMQGQYNGRPLSYYSNFDDLLRISGADLHRDTSGKPQAFAFINPDSSNNPQLVFWPYPDDIYVIEVQYKRKFTDLSTFGGEVFGTDAPDMAYLAVEYGCREYACMWDEDSEKAQYWGGKKYWAIGRVKARENRAHQAEKSMKVYTGRRSYGQGIEVRSQQAFDTVPIHR